MSMLMRILLLLILLLTIDYFTGMFKFIPISIFVTMNTIASVFASTAYTASVHELVNNQKIHQLSSLTSGANSLSNSNIFAPMFGIGVYAAFGFRVFVWIAMGALLLSALIVTTMRFYYNEVSSNVDNVLEEKSSLKNFQVGLIYVSKRPLIKMLIFVAVFLNFIFAAINIGLPYIINTQLSLNNALIGILDTFNALGGLVAALLLNFWPDNKGEKFKIIAPLFICSFYFILLGILLLITKNVHLISIIGGAIMFFGGFGVAMLNITTQVNIQKTTPTKILGRVTTIMTTACTIIMPIGTLIFTNH
ncbi:MFS transporter [Weissella sagaensis]|uniref:MFS transporter n=1 Tax=Weissella sagaensis TaxID=2559928 RepID=UPI0030B8AFFE